MSRISRPIRAFSVSSLRHALLGQRNHTLTKLDRIGSHRQILLEDAEHNSFHAMKSVEIAKVLGVTGSWVNSIKRLHAAGKPLEPKSRVNKRKPLAQREGERLRARVAEHAGTTLEDLKRDLNLSDSISNIWYALQALGITLKKKRSGPANAIVPTSPSSGPSGRSSKRGSTRVASSSSTRPSAPRR
jgi:transposase